MTVARAALLLFLALTACSNPRRVGDERKAPPKAEAPDEPSAKGVGAKPGRPQAPAAPEGLLTPGTLSALQRALANRGVLKASHRSGELDAATAAALRRFQEEEGLAATGMPDRETLSRLGLDPDAAFGRNEPEAGGAGSREGTAK